MPFGACQLLLDRTLVNREFGSNLDLGLLVSPSRQEDVAPLGWQGLERVKHSSQSKPCARRALGVRRVVGEVDDCGGIGRREQHFMTPPVFRLIDCHPIEIGDWLPDLPYSCAALELEIGVVERLGRGVSGSQRTREPEEQQIIFCLQQGKQTLESRVRNALGAKWGNGNRKAPQLGRAARPAKRWRAAVLHKLRRRRRLASPSGLTPPLRPVLQSPLIARFPKRWSCNIMCSLGKGTSLLR